MLCDVPLEHRRLGRERWYAKLDHTPKPGQAALDGAVDAGYRFLGFFTPPQDGKSFHVSKHVGSYFLLPDVHGWIVAPTYQDGAKEFSYLYQDFARMGLLRSARRKHFDIRGGNMHIELANGSWVQVISAENPENLRREQVDILILAEASKLHSNLYQRHLYARLERRRGLCFVPTTHKGYGWVYDDFRVRSLPVKPKSWTWGPWMDRGTGAVRDRIGGEPNADYDPEYWSTQVSYVEDFGEILHRGEFSPEQIATARRRLPVPMFAEQFGGDAASYQGLVYPFDPVVHECDPFAVPPDWPVVVGYDHGAGGGSDPTAILLGSYGSDGTLYWWREIYDIQIRAVSQRASLLRIALGGRTPSAVMRGQDAKQVGRELLDAGFPNSFAADGAVDARIIRMTSLMQERKWKIFRGRCPNLKREMLAYEWDEKDPGAPVDGNDHALEAAGYASLARVGLPERGADASQAGETPEQRVQRLVRERLWKGWMQDEERREQRTKDNRLLDIVDPNPFRGHGVGGRAYRPL